MHCPPQQNCPLGQTWLQAPQLLLSVWRLAQWPGKLVPGSVPPGQAVRWLGLAPGPQVQHNPWHLVASLAQALWFAVSPPKTIVQKWAQVAFGVQGGAGKGFACLRARKDAAHRRRKEHLDHLELPRLGGEFTTWSWDCALRSGYLLSWGTWGMDMWTA
jgi:hypothetical protein